MSRERFDAGTEIQVKSHGTRGRVVQDLGQLVLVVWHGFPKGAHLPRSGTHGWTYRHLIERARA